MKEFLAKAKKYWNMIEAPVVAKPKTAIVVAFVIGWLVG